MSAMVELEVGLDHVLEVLQEGAAPFGALQVSNRIYN